MISLTIYNRLEQTNNSYMRQDRDTKVQYIYDCIIYIYIHTYIRASIYQGVNNSINSK